MNNLVFRFTCCLIVAGLGLTSCGPPPPPSTPTPTLPPTQPPSTIDLTVTPGNTLPANSGVAIIANVNPVQDLGFLKWSVSGTSGGSVHPSIGGQVVYTAGSNPGVDIVVAEGTTANGEYIHKTTTITVVSGPTPTAVTAPSKEKWPQDLQKAAEVFTNGQGEWTQNQYGGWTLKAVWPPIEVNIPSGITFEGYNDGPEPPVTFICFTVLGPAQIRIQGGTFWYPDDPSNPAWTANHVHKVRKDKNCAAIGFVPD